MIFMPIIALIILGLTLRAFLVMAGYYKSPLLHSFQTYGEEKLTSPVLTFIIWLSVCAVFFLIFVVNLTGWMMLVFLSIAIGSILYDRKEHIFKHFSGIFFRYPGWYYRLYQRTSREERRRLAYMWLFLPPGTRMVYNTHDGFFNKWVDLVLMTVTE